MRPVLRLVEEGIEVAPRQSQLVTMSSSLHAAERLLGELKDGVAQNASEGAFSTCFRRKVET